MRRLFVGNFSFEQTLNSGFSPSKSILQFEDELACLWRSVATENDAIILKQASYAESHNQFSPPGVPGCQFLTRSEASTQTFDEIVPWGWSPQILELSQALKISVHCPEFKVVNRVNSRQFSFEVCQQLNETLQGEGIATNLAEVMPILQECHNLSGGWIIKPNLGQAGRGHLRGNSPFLNEAQFGTLLNTLSKYGAVAIEPLLHRQQELGLQWSIHPDKSIEFLGATLLLTDEQGRYQGTSVPPFDVSAKLLSRLESIQYNAVQSIAEAGYFGPVGIDAMLYTPNQTQGSQLLLRPIQDINARWTMGRVAIEWAKHFQPSSALDQSGHASPVRPQFTGGRWIHATESPSPEAIPLSPSHAAGIPFRTRTWWL